LQRILILDAPAVLGPARITELDERYAFAVIVAALRAAADAGSLQVDDPETVTRLLLGALTRGAMLIANSPDPVGTRHAVALSMRALLSGFATPAREADLFNGGWSLQGSEVANRFMHIGLDDPGDESPDRPVQQTPRQIGGQVKR
jgi:hypothetical protein